MQGNTNDWETAKENIQPLKVGRKMSSLAHSLQRDLDSSVAHQLEAEAEVMSTIEKFEKDIACYDGDDPLKPWAYFISYLVQERLNEHVKYREKYKEVVLCCFRKFMKDPGYKNDRRLVEIYLRTIQPYPADRRIELLKMTMSGGLGAKVASVYITLGSWYELIGDTKSALDIIKVGITQGAEPLSVLTEYQTTLEFKITGQLAASMTRSCSPEEDICVRVFGNQVPIGHDNEADCIRLQLTRATSCTGLIPGTKKLDNFDIFKDDKDFSSLTTLVLNPIYRDRTYEPVEEIARIEAELENLIDPTKWNSRGTELPEMDIPTFEKIHVYTDDTSPVFRNPAEFKENSSGKGQNTPTQRKPTVQAPLEQPANAIGNKRSSHVRVSRTTKDEAEERIAQNLWKRTFGLDKWVRNGVDVSPEEVKAEQFVKKLAGKNLKHPPIATEHTIALVSALDAATNPNNPNELETVGREFNSFKEQMTKEFEKFVQANNSKMNDLLALVHSSKREVDAVKVLNITEFHGLRADVNEITKKAYPPSEQILKAIFEELMKFEEEFRASTEELAELREEYAQYKEEKALETMQLREECTKLNTALETACEEWGRALIKFGELDTNTNKVDEVEKKKPENTENLGPEFPAKENCPPIVVPLQGALRPSRKTFTISREETMSDENLCVNTNWKQPPQQRRNSVSFRQPLTTLVTCSTEVACADEEDIVENAVDHKVGERHTENEVAQMTQAVFNYNNMNVTNLTDVLNFRPLPMHCSSPVVPVQRQTEVVGVVSKDELEEENDSVELPEDFSAHPVGNFYLKRYTFNQTMAEAANNLSTIQETSKERSPSTFTGRSSSANMTAFTSFRSTANTPQVRLGLELVTVNAEAVRFCSNNDQ